MSPTLAFQRKENKPTMNISDLGPLSPTHPPPILLSPKTFHSSLEKLRTNTTLYPHEESEEPVNYTTTDSDTEYPFNMDASWMTEGETDRFLPTQTSKGDMNSDWGCRRPAAVRGRVLSTRWTHSPDFYDCEGQLGQKHWGLFQRRLLAGAYFAVVSLSIVGVCFIFQGLAQ